jgi:hypothetical protein
MNPTPTNQHNTFSVPYKRDQWRLSRPHVTLLIVLVCIVPSFAAVVGYPIISPHKATAGCRITQITLHGFDAPTLSCLDGQKRSVHTRLVAGSGPLAVPQVFEDACYDDDLVLHWDSNLNGDKLCVNGSGVLNLTDVWNYNRHASWNDEVSSFWTGCYSDYFYTDINRGGGVAWAPGSPGGFYSEWDNFPLGQVPNDTLSSIWQYYSYGGSHCGS